MTDQEINRVIAEWCGFEKIEGKPQESWYEPDKSCIYCGVNSLPNFLDPIKGLGLMFKYAVPKLLGEGVAISIFPARKDTLVILDAGIFERGKFSMIDKDPTRALAMAIYKVIKGER